MQGRDRGNFLALDRLRGVAALLVLFDHAGSLLFGFDPVPRNHLAVHFFFMLSGFVIACGYDARLRSGLSAAGFLRLRAIRLYPLVTTGSLLGALALWMTDPSFVSDPMAIQAVAMSALALPFETSGFSFGHFPINPPEWSLFFEILMNLGFALAAPRLSQRQVVLVAVLGSVCHAIMQSLASPYPMPFAAETLGALGAFASGVALWRWRSDRGTLFRRLPQPLLIAGLVGICMAPLEMGWQLDPVATMLGFPLLIMAGAAHGRSPNEMSQLGALSFPLYITHWPVLLLAQVWLAPAIGSFAAAVLACAAALVLAWMTLHGIDIPLRRWLGASGPRDKILPPLPDIASQAARP